MDCDANSRLESGTQLIILTHHGCFWSRDLKYDLVKKTPSLFSYANMTYARLFVKHNYPARHKYTIGRPRLAPIG